MTPDDARGMGAQALFGENAMRSAVVSMGESRIGAKAVDKQPFARTLRRYPMCARPATTGHCSARRPAQQSSGIRRIER